MDLRKRVASLINQILMQYGIRQEDLSKMLGIGLASLSAYLKAKELPRVDVLLKLAEIGGMTMDDLLKTDKPPQKKEVSITVKTGDGSPVSGITAHGDIYQNTIVRRVYKYTYQPGDLTDEQSAKLHLLVEEIINLEQTVKRKPKSHAAVWNALKRKFKVPYYRRIKESDFDKAEAFLRMWIGRLTKPLQKKDEDLYRKKRYVGIFTVAKKYLGWTKEEMDNYIFAEFGVTSIKNLDNDQLERLYYRAQEWKKKFLEKGGKI